jgi:hypothetical protein
MFWMNNQRGSALIYILIFTAVIGMLTYKMQSFMGEQADRAELKSHDDVKKILGQELDVLLSSGTLCSSQVVLTGVDGFEVQPYLRSGATYLGRYIIQSMKVENKENIGFNAHSANFVVTLGSAMGATTEEKIKVSRQVVYTDGNDFRCQSSPDKKKECEKMGAKIVDGRCTICETLGGIWRQGECRI